MKHEKNSELSKFFIQYKKQIVIGLSAIVLSSGIGFAVIQTNNHESSNEPSTSLKQTPNKENPKKNTTPKKKNTITKSEKKQLEDILENSSELGNQTQRLLTPKERKDVQTILKSNTPDVVKQLLARKEEEKGTPDIKPLVPTIPSAPTKPSTPSTPINPPLVIESTPKIQATGNNILPVGALLNPYDYFIVTDAADGNVKITIDTSSINNQSSGIQYFTVTAINKFSRAASVDIPIQFVNKPVLALKEPVMYLKIGDTLNMDQATATDEIDGDITDKIAVEKNDFIQDKEGTYYVTYAVTNSYGLQSRQTLTIQVQNEAPTFEYAEFHHEINQPIDLLQGITAKAYNGELISLTEKNILSSDVDVSKEGQYTVTYQASDRFGKQSEVVERKVFVENEAPVIHNLVSKEFHVGSILTKEELIKEVVLTDREDDRLNIPLVLTVDESQFLAINSNVVGTYPFTVSTVDSMGKIATKTVEVKIINDLPVLHGLEDKVIPLGTLFDPLEGVSATDTETPQLTVNYEYVGQPLDENVAGEYVIHYSVTDAHGGKTEKNRKITVEDSKQDNLVNEAKKWLGTAYSWGGGGINGPTLGIEQDANVVGFDCSSFVQYVLHTQGVTLSRVTTTQENEGIDVPLNQIQAGDLLFFGERGNTDHVALYIGNNEFIHAPESGDVIKITNIANFKPSFAKRVLN